MIRYALSCGKGHEFEAWFSNSEAYDRQRKRKQVDCPVCGDVDVRKQIMAPAVRSTKGKAPAEQDAPSPAQIAEMAAKVRKHIEDTHEYVGESFAEQAREMYYGEQAERPVWGVATPQEARELAEEGVPAAPLPKPFAPDPPKRRERLN